MNFNILLIFTIFSTTSGYGNPWELTADPGWDDICEELKPTHVFYEEFEGETTCRLRSPQAARAFGVSFLPESMWGPDPNTPVTM